MKSKHYLTHLVRAHHEQTKRSESTIPVAVAKEELRKAFSKEHLTSTLKRRLLARRKRDELLQQLLHIEQELLESHGEHSERVERLLAHIQRMKKKAEEKI